MARIWFDNLYDQYSDTRSCEGAVDHPLLESLISNGIRREIWRKESYPSQTRNI